MSSNESFVANCPISRPISLPGVTADVDLNGLMFSYQWGPVYVVGDFDAPLRMPAEF